MSSVYANWNEDDTVDTLRNISLEVKEKQLFAVIGPVGCGKVTGNRSELLFLKMSYYLF